MAPPKQKPGRSKQDYSTPPEFLAALKNKLGIGQFDIDLAASAENAVCVNYYDEAMDSLADHNSWQVITGGWAFCNPPYADIRPWVMKAYRESVKGAQVAMLVPASVGSNWWRTWVDGAAYVLFLNGRLAFMPNKPKWLYPKDTAVLLYSKWLQGGYGVWSWREEIE